MANGDLKALFDESMESVVLDWLKEGFSEKEISEKLTVDRIKNTMLAIMEKSAEDSLAFFRQHLYEIAYDE